MRVQGRRQSPAFGRGTAYLYCMLEGRKHETKGLDWPARVSRAPWVSYRRLHLASFPIQVVGHRPVYMYKYE